MPPIPADLVCFTHLPWDYVFQRPNHLLTRAARGRRVVVVEQPQDAPRPSLSARRSDGVTVLRPGLPPSPAGHDRDALLAGLVEEWLEGYGVSRPWRWYYDPMAFRWSSAFEASAVVYDCMDELGAFKDAPAGLAASEDRLLAAADVVFAGGRRLFETRRRRHPDVHLFPSAVDVAHFRRARTEGSDPADQAGIGPPRIGWFGVIDERMDLDLLRDVAARRPDWSFVLVGPVAKIDPASLPVGPNLHWLGQRPYGDLPAYLGGWDVAMMPFARNDSTAFISPTKTPEYLAGGRPVVSTSIADVVHPYGDIGLARIADNAAGWVAAIEASLTEEAGPRIAAADRFLAGMSWDRTWAEMERLVDRAARRRAGLRKSPPTDWRQGIVPAGIAAAGPAAAVAAPGSAGAVE